MFLWDNDHYYHRTGNVGSQSAGLAGFPFTVMKASLRLEAAAKATLDSAGPGVVTDEEPRVKSGKIQYESKVLTSWSM